MRTFISIELPEEIKENIEAVVSKMRLMLTPIKWVEKKNLHVTVKFLGWVEDPKVEDLTRCVSECVKGYGKIDVAFKGLGVFPDARHPRVVWVDMPKGCDKVKALADKVECAVADRGYRKEERDFTPHLTIGRIKEKLDVEALGKFIAENENTEFGGFTVDHISLMKSTLRRTGPIYEEMEQIKL